MLLRNPHVAYSRNVLAASAEDTSELTRTSRRVDTFLLVVHSGVSVHVAFWRPLTSGDSVRGLLRIS